MINAAALIGSCDLLWITLDTLRLDVARAGIETGRTPFLNSLLPGGQWEARHTPGNFTYAAHHAFFAGFLPTPTAPGRHPRLFAARFPGSETTRPETCVVEAPTIPEGLARRGYHTVCIGGVGFFNQLSPQGSVLPGLFNESHWRREFGVTDRESTANQVRCAVQLIEQLPGDQRLFLFLNVSALHQPNCYYVEGATEDSPRTQLAALEYVDSQLPPLFAVMQRRAELLTVICSDHGTAYGEDGYAGHRLGHEVVWTVPYAEMLLPKMEVA